MGEREYPRSMPTLTGGPVTSWFAGGGSSVIVIDISVGCDFGDESGVGIFECAAHNEDKASSGLRLTPVLSTISPENSATIRLFAVNFI